MPSLFRFCKLPLLILPLFALTACGDGWEVVYTKDILPYGNERTAGSGVMYVRKMMPAKALNIEPMLDLAPPAEMMAEPAPEVEEPVVEIKDDGKLQKNFTNLQRK